MNEVFAAVNMVDLVAGIIIIAVGLVAVYVIFVGYRLVVNALGEGDIRYETDDHGFEYSQTRRDDGSWGAHVYDGSQRRE